MENIKLYFQNETHQFNLYLTYKDIPISVVQDIALRLECATRFALNALVGYNNENNPSNNFNSIFDSSRIDKEINPSHNRVLKTLVIKVDTEGEKDACSRGNLSYFYFSRMFLLNLPESESYSTHNLRNSEKRCLGTYIGYLFHEVFHMLGAFHTKTGIMSGPLDLLSDVDDLNNFKLENYMETTTQIVIQRALETPSGIMITAIDLGDERVFRLESSHNVVGILYHSKDNFDILYEEFSPSQRIENIRKPHNCWAITVFCESGPGIYINQSDMKNGRTIRG